MGADARASCCREMKQPTNNMITIIETPNGMTIRELREWLCKLPDTDEEGNEREVWVTTGIRRSSIVVRGIALNHREDSCDVLLESSVFTPTQTMTPETALKMDCPPETCSASFGYQWITPLGRRAFCWTIKQGRNGMMLVGCTYNDDTKEWDGESTCDINAALRKPATGRVPDVPKLRRRLQHLIANEIYYTIRPSGTY